MNAWLEPKPPFLFIYQVRSTFPVCSPFTKVLTISRFWVFFFYRNFSASKKWLITSIVTTSVLAITLTSSAYSGSAGRLLIEFGTSRELVSLGVSLFVLGFAIGPACWAPLSELYGRRVLFVTTHAFVVAFVAAAAGSNSMASLLVFRFLSGVFGASPMTNSGGVIADLFPPSQRGIALSIFAAAPFMVKCFPLSPQEGPKRLTPRHRRVRFWVHFSAVS